MTGSADAILTDLLRQGRVAVLIPCLNEEQTIATVIRGFQAALPGARIYVYDNASSDRTAAVAAEAGALVRRERIRGKGNVIRRMFADLDAELYIMTDGDATYDPTAAPEMCRLVIEEGCDMVTGVRVHTADAAYRPGHQFGNRLLTGIVQRVFGNRCTDMLSGYRVFTRRFVKSFPSLARGFETETEFTVHALEMRMAIGEVRSAYHERPAGSASKLRTIRDGLRILRTILILVKEERPLHLFGAAAIVAFVISLLLGLGVVIEFWQTGLVERFPTAILAASGMIFAVLCLFSGLILHGITRTRRSILRLAYLALPAAPWLRD